MATIRKSRRWCRIRPFFIFNVLGYPRTATVASRSPWFGTIVAQSDDRQVPQKRQGTGELHAGLRLRADDGRGRSRRVRRQCGHGRRRDPPDLSTLDYLVVG